MAITRFTGPIIVPGSGPAISGVGDGADYNGPGPSIFVHGVGLVDQRFGPYMGADASAIMPCWYGSGWFNVLDQAPSTLSATNIVAAAVPVAGTAMTLAVASTGITVVPAGGYTYVSNGNTFPANALMIDGNPGVVLTNATGGQLGGPAMYDPRTMIGRCLRFTSVGNDSTGTAAVVGIDIYGYLVHETVTLSNATIATSKKALKAVISITPGGTLSGSNLSVGTSDVYGFPIAVYEAAQNTVLPPYVFIYWNGTQITASTGYVAGVTTTPSATTGDVRGTYATQTASDGTKKLQVFVQPQPWNLTGTTLFGAAQF
jgi:hypothetical protein